MTAHRARVGLLLVAASAGVAVAQAPGRAGQTEPIRYLGAIGDRLVLPPERPTGDESTRVSPRGAATTNVRYRIIELGTLGQGGDVDEASNATALNELGHVAGIAEDAPWPFGMSKAFVYRDGQMINLDPASTIASSGKGLNEVGDVVGWWVQPVLGGPGFTGRPFITNDATPMFDPIATVPGFGIEAWGINDAGQVAIRGGARCWDPVLGLIEIAFPDTPAGSDGQSWEINQSGVVCGETRRADNWLHAYRYDIAGATIEDLHDAVAYRNTFAYGINDLGDVAGYGDAWTNELHPVIWPAAGGLIEMPTGDIRADLLWSHAEHINNHGDVVGQDVSIDPVPPVGWVAFDVINSAPGTKHVLWSLIFDPAEQAQWTERLHPFEINDAGQIAGTGVFNGRTRAFLMTPCPGPSGDADHSYTVDVNDIAYIVFRLGSSDAGDQGADVDGNGLIDVNDIAFSVFRLGNTGCGV